MLSFVPRGVLDEILNLIESVSEDFPSYSKISYRFMKLGIKEFHRIMSWFQQIKLQTTLFFDGYTTLTLYNRS